MTAKGIMATRGSTSAIERPRPFWHNRRRVAHEVQKIIATVADHTNCPLYESGDGFDYIAPQVSGRNNAPVCAFAVSAFTPAFKRILAGEHPTAFPRLSCGGCGAAEARFNFDLVVIEARDSKHAASLAALDGLAKSRIFSAVPVQRLRLALPLFDEFGVPAGATLIDRGKMSPGLFVVLDGSFDVIRPNDAGGEGVIAALGPGECFGEMSVITGDVATATVRAHEAGRLLGLPRDDLQKLYGILPSLPLVLMRLLAGRLAATSSKLVNELGRSMKGRLDSISPADIVQAINVSQQTGELAAEHAGRRIAIYFSEGQVFDVALDGFSPEDAFCDFIAWHSGTFQFEPKKKDTPRRVTTDTTGLLLEAMRRMDEKHA